MKALVVFLIDEVVCEDRLEGARITAKIHKDRVGYVSCDGETRIYARIEKVTLTK